MYKDNLKTNMQRKLKKREKIKKAVTPIKSDALFKKIIQDEVAAREFLEYYLPVNFKKLVDLTKISVEKESFVEDNLKRRFSDIIYKIKTKDNEEAFIYTLIEHQSEPDDEIRKKHHLGMLEYFLNTYHLINNSPSAR